MNTSSGMLWCVVGVVSASALVPTGWSWLHAVRLERAESLRLERVKHQAQKLGDLKTKLPEWALAAKAAGTLAPEVSAALGASGLPASAMASLSADPETAGTPGASAAGIQVRHRHATLVLGSVTLAQLGTFLQTWRQRQPAWTVSMMDVSPEPNGAALKAQTGGDLPLHAVLTMETLTLERSGGVH